MRFDGQELAGKPTESIVRLGVAHVPDGRGTFTGLTVEENLRLGAITRRDRAGVAEDFEKTYTRFPRLRERRHQQAGTLSGGEQQMLAISRALMLRPRLLLLDEPSFGLAPLVVAEIFRIMRRINREDRVSMLLVEQNASLALDLADHAYLLETGRVALSGPSEQVKADESVLHNPHNREGNATNRHDSSRGGRIGTELAVPEAGAQNRRVNGRRTILSLLHRKKPGKQWPHPSHREVVA